MKIRIILPKRGTIEKNKEYLTKVQGLIKDFITVNGSKIDEGTTIALRDFLRNNGVGFDSIVNVPTLMLAGLLVEISMIVTIALKKDKKGSLEVTLSLWEVTIE